MSNKSLENLNSQFINVLKSLNIEDTKHQKLSINLDLNKKIKTIISIQSLEERKSNIPKYLNNPKSYISLLSLSLSLNTKTLYTVFCNNNGINILHDILENQDKEKSSLALDLIYRLVQTYDMEYNKKLVIGKACEYGRWEILDILENYEILFDGECLCKMLIFKFLNSFPNEFVCKIQQTKFEKIYKYIKNNEIYVNEKEEKKLEKNDDEEKQKQLEKVILDTLFLRNEKGNPVKIHYEKLTTSREVKLVDEPTINKLNNDLNELKINKKEDNNKKTLKKKMVFKKKEPSVSYLPIKWTKISKMNTLFASLDLEKYKTFFSKEDLEYFVIKKDIKKEPEKQADKKKESPIDPKKAYALNIALSRIKCEYKLVVSEILNQDLILINENLVNQLLLYFPSDQEMSNILLSDLEDKYILFFKECEDCYLDIKENLKGIKLNILIRNFNINNILLFIKFFEDLIKSEYMKCLLGSILCLGNIVNKGTTYGNAEGFSIKDIQDILNMRVTPSTTKSISSNKIEIMNYKRNNILTIRDIIKKKIPQNDININNNIKNQSYDNLLSEFKEIIELKREYSYNHKEYEVMYEKYKEMIDRAEEVRKMYGIERITDEMINILISLIEIPDKH
ncbi:formin-like protein [Vairimorpha necatrix]|uniref:Formin-like protein n=1 Tax=Vairimorpha necatrix TaxID=6039 RepID=A0AAX4JBK6_9MICR